MRLQVKEEAMARRKCSSCGRELAEEEKVCLSCGTPVVSGGGAREGLETEPEERGQLVRCPDCGGEVSSRALFCPHCGAPRMGTAAFQRILKPDWGFEWRTQAEIFGLPLIHVAVGRKEGKLRVAKGVIAIGQFALGLITVAQFGVGLLFGFGQFIFGFTAIAQFAITIIFGVGQFALGWVAIGQVAVGYYALGQMAIGAYVWMTKHCDPEARKFFLDLLKLLGF